jgi:hypothetical protein
MHLVTKPLFIRRLGLAINESAVQVLWNRATPGWGMEGGGYIRDLSASYVGGISSALAFLDTLQHRRGTYAPNWPAELLESPNLFDFLRNDPVDLVDPFGNVWYNPWTWPAGVLEWLETVFSKTADEAEIAGTGLGTTECLEGMYKAVPDLRRGNQFKQTFDPFDPNSPPIDPTQPAG